MEVPDLLALESPARSGSKRARDEDTMETADDQPPQKTQTTYVKHEVHWALDGNLLFQFGRVRFKLYRGRLAAESPFIQALIDTSNGTPNADYPNQDEVEKIVQTKEVFDGLDCFFFDKGGVPSSHDFAALLDIMDSAM